MESSDHIIDIGPEAGLKGGQIVAEGGVKQIIKNEKSITGNYLSGKKFIGIPKRRTAKNGRFIEISGASGNNLKKVDLKFLLVLLLVSLVYLVVVNQHLFFTLFIMLLI